MALGDEKRLERRGRLLAAARDLLARVGYDNVTMTALAEASGVTRPTLYNTFGSKDELLYEAVLETYEDLLDAAGPSAGMRGLDRVLAILTAIAETIASNPDYARTLLESFQSRAGARPLGKAIRSGGLRALTEALEEMRDDGEIEAWVDVGALGRRIAALQRGTNAEWLAGGIGPGELTDATVFSACLMLAGAAAPDTADRCRGIARERQERLSRGALEAAGASSRRR